MASSSSRFFKSLSFQPNETCDTHIKKWTVTGDLWSKAHPKRSYHCADNATMQKAQSYMNSGKYCEFNQSNDNIIYSCYFANH